MEVQKGVPQGSVLGPLIWIMVYDKVLGIKKEPGCEVIGYADDTMITSTATTYEEAKLRTCMQAERTIHTIRKLGLKVAVEKTEVMVFQGKKREKTTERRFCHCERQRNKNRKITEIPWSDIRWKTRL